VTVHTGLDMSDHGVTELDKGHLLDRERVWDMVSASGKPVWVCGSMSTAYRKPLNGYLLPDPGTGEVAPYPEEITGFFNFVQRNVQEYTNDRSPLSAADYASFVAFLASHGLSLATATSTVQQLVREKAKGQRWKRAVILDKLQCDVFGYIYRKIRPAFSTFFLNSTAHYQHFYWRNMEPEQFKIKPTEQENTEYGEAILFGYQEMDRLIGRFMELAGSNATIVLATALSQQPCVLYEEDGGKKIFRPREFDAALDFIGIKRPYRVSPVMSNQFHIFFETEEDAKAAHQQLDRVHVLDQRALNSYREGKAVLSGAQLIGEPNGETLIEIADMEKKARFFDLFYQIEGLKSGMHHQDGVLWIRTPRRQHWVAEEKVPLRTVAPTVLELLGMPKPSYMKGESVLPRMASVAT
jgi:predicted AlkP superfamily phosphohydrolase/phosphomutase